MEEKYVLSLSGGKDSTALLHLILEKNLPLDEVLFFDTGWEWPEMYDHLNMVEKKTGIKITRLNPPMPFEYYMKEVEIKRGKYKGLKGYGWPWVKVRWCTRLKCTALHNYAKKAFQYIGIAFDEQKRIKNDNPLLKYPLVDYKFTEKDCLEYCLKLGYNWGGLYEKRNRVSCFCCPLQRVGQLKMLYNERPELWAYMKSIDRINNFTKSIFQGKTLKEWEERFNKENETEKENK